MDGTVIDLSDVNLVGWPTVDLVDLVVAHQTFVDMTDMYLVDLVAMGRATVDRDAVNLMALNAFWLI